MTNHSLSHRADDLTTALLTKAEAYRAHAKSDATHRAYAADWRDWIAWCAGRDVAALPADPRAVALYLTDRASTHRVSTLARRLAALQHAHNEAGLAFERHHPTLRSVWSGIRRTHGIAPAQQAPILTADLRRLVATLPDDLGGLRDRALLLLGFAGAFRRSELVALDVADVVAEGPGLVITIRRGKTDQERAGRIVAIPFGAAEATCPVRALAAWLAASGIARGPIFRQLTAKGTRVAPSGDSISTRVSDRAVARIVQRAALAAGLVGAFAGHSLRAGLITSAAAAGVSEHDIMRHTGHRRAETLRRYIRRATAFEANPAGRVGL